MSAKDALREARERYQALREQQKALQEAFEKSPEYQTIKAQVEEAERVRDEADALFREHALEEYSRTKNKQGDGYTIRIQKEAVIVVDQNDIKEWALTNYTAALSLNLSVIKSEAKAGRLPERFVSVEEVPTVAVSSTL